MKWLVPLDPSARARRKADLLLASELARGQAVGALTEVGHRVDWVARAVIRARAWAAQPQAWVAGGALVSALALVALPRVRLLRLLRWGLIGTRAWRIGQAFLRARR